MRPISDIAWLQVKPDELIPNAWLVLVRVGPNGLEERSKPFVEKVDGRLVTLRTGETWEVEFMTRPVKVQEGAIFYAAASRWNCTKR